MTRTWWQNEDILERFRDWLTHTGAELAALDESGEILVAEDEPAELPPEIGLLQVVEAFTAMRHELKLQTKSTRGLDESVQAALGGLDAAMRQFQTAQAREQEAADRAAKPLVETLVSVDEALLRGARAIEAAHRQVTQEAPRKLRQSLDEQFHQLPRWRRWLASAWHKQVELSCADHFARVDAETFANLMDGYRLIQTRLERMLRDHQIQRIDAVGHQVDPARMTVVDLVDDPHEPPETVVAEVRPGYLWRGQVIRYAEVRAVRGGGAAAVAAGEEEDDFATAERASPVEDEAG